MQDASREIAKRELREQPAGEMNLTLAPTELDVTSDARPGRATCSLGGELTLDPAWQPGDEPIALLSEIAAELHGSVEAALFNPFLPGVRAVKSSESRSLQHMRNASNLDPIH